MTLRDIYLFIPETFEYVFLLAKEICRVDSSDSKFAPSHVLLRLGNGASVPPFTQARVIQV